MNRFIVLLFGVVLTAGVIVAQSGESGRGVSSGQRNSNQGVSVGANQDKQEDPDKNPLADENGLVPQIFQRVVPADVLRDYPGFCFGSSNCRLFRPGHVWQLAPYCGISICEAGPEKQLIEVIQDCGPEVVNTDGCTLVRKANNATEVAFPHCCPVYECEKGRSVDFGVPKN